MADDDLKNIEDEIAVMQKSEKELERVLAVQQIISAYRTVSALVDQLPLSVSASLPLDGISLQPHGFLLDGLLVNIENNESLVIIKNGNEVSCDVFFLLVLSKRVRAAAAEFIKTIKEKIVEEKEKLMKKLESF